MEFSLSLQILRHGGVWCSSVVFVYCSDELIRPALDGRCGFIVLGDYSPELKARYWAVMLLFAGKCEEWRRFSGCGARFCFCLIELEVIGWLSVTWELLVRAGPAKITEKSLALGGYLEVVVDSGRGLVGLAVILLEEGENKGGFWSEPLAAATKKRRFGSGDGQKKEKLNGVLVVNLPEFGGAPVNLENNEQ
ncbi:hypothetical protein H5410_041072 [Solanum commersonii]|uniref:Uncharacterized protein n=1 Tax=Solanum commersonii TaxID=4109 RepID=A0A9J5XUE4_SOLCO|nr:hypothetical protein H5410_041072 [Solanum commersonii]